MKIVDIQAQHIHGLTVRTCNADEMQPSTAKIGALWADFYTQHASKMTADSQVYGVYDQYESDFRGQFNVLAGATALANSENLKVVSIEAGSYLVFRHTGAMPQAVIAAWSEIWQYFSAVDCPHQRAYTTDFEHYIKANEVAVHIAIQAPQ